MKVLFLFLLAASSAFADFAELVKSGDVHDAKHQFDEALEFYLPAEKLDPDNADAKAVKVP